MTTAAYIAIGSNVGDRRATIAAAIAAIAATPGVVVLRVAEPIETKPEDCPPDSEPFLNSAAAIETTLNPAELLALLHAIERRLGRERSVPNAPRTIDLDLLLLGDQIIDTPGLTVPHPRMHQRRFVLAPLAAIARDVIHPVLKKSIAELLNHLETAPHSST